ncbi:MAG TPA: flavin reductase family protein [Mycobacteriales bacterium]|jgi:flavin reductase (DIM6/NTAB) family NADH-FMN oxidoreductase RutF|nr:flavin reductase family protein [Mycobacteriales bacterium]
MSEERLEIAIADLDVRSAYSLMTTCLIPRPIAWVSSLAASGVDNLAPHSFTTVAGIDPLTVCFVSIGTKDTLRNVRETGEFVLNIGTERQARVMNDCATDFDGQVSEFDAAGLEREPSLSVRPPRVAGAPISMECRAAGEHVIAGSVMVFGQVLRIGIARACLAADGRPDPRLVAPLARLGRNQWATLGEVFALDRIKAADWDGGERSPEPGLA